MRSAEDGNGLRARQALARATTLRNPTSLMVQLLDLQYTSSDPRVKLCQWTKNANEHQEKTGEIISEQIRRAS